MSGLNLTNQRLGPRPPHTNNASQRRQEETHMLVYIATPTLQQCVFKSNVINMAS